MADNIPNTPKFIRFQNAHDIEIRVEDFERKRHEIPSITDFLLSILTPKIHHPLFRNIKLYHALQNVNVIGNGISFTAYILYEVPIEMLRGNSGDEIQQMLIPYAHEIVNLSIEGTIAGIAYKVIHCVLDNIVICDDMMEEENEGNEEILWIWELANDIARSPCSESKYSASGDLTLYDESWDLLKEPEE